MNRTDLAVSSKQSPDAVRPGERLAFEFTVSNNGPNPATVVRVLNRLPEQLTYHRVDHDCHEDGDGRLVCELGEIPARQSITLKVDTIVDFDALPQGTSSTTIRNIATVENLAGPDLVPDNNKATGEIEIVAGETR